MIKTLIDNDPLDNYPLDFIFATINSRIKLLSYKYNIERKKTYLITVLIITIQKASLYNIKYKINCQNCDSSYMGQTKRKLKIRIKEHKADINKPSNLLSVISCIN